MKSLPDASVDLILTDPPYGSTACKWDSIIPFDKMWLELKRIRRGPVVLFGTEPFSSNLRMSNIKEYKYDWTWKKNKPDGFLYARFRPLAKTETITVFSKDKIKYNPQVKKCPPFKHKKTASGGKLLEVYHFDAVKKPEYEIRDFKYPDTILEFDKPKTKERVHPTQKPVALLEYLIKTYTLEGETVLDFTMGSGSTGVACKNLNRKFIGIEQDEKYYQIAVGRCRRTDK